MDLKQSMIFKAKRSNFCDWTIFVTIQNLIITSYFIKKMELVRLSGGNSLFPTYPPFALEKTVFSPLLGQNFRKFVNFPCRIFPPLVKLQSFLLRLTINISPCMYMHYSMAELIMPITKTSYTFPKKVSMVPGVSKKCTCLF
jgi:hypothetical protein